MDKKKYNRIIILLILALLATFLLSLSVGEISIPFLSLFEALSDPQSMEFGVLTYIRIPRTLLALCVGGSLSLCGVILQGIYRNPLVEPYTLGISGGASFGVALAIVSGLSLLSKFIVPLFAFAGAFSSIFLVYVLSMTKRGMNINRMLLIGVMISFIASSMVMFLISITTVDKIGDVLFWTMGSLNETDSTMINSMVILSALILVISYLFTTPLNALRIGESKAKHLGINTAIVIRLLFILTSLLTGFCITVAGVIGFVGLTIPHITRLMVGTDYKILLISSFLNGGIFLILCDMISRTIISPNELPVGVITGIFGGITFIFILSRSRNKIKVS